MHTAPKDGSSILAIVLGEWGEKIEIIWWQDYENCCWSSDSEIRITPIKWIPLPEIS